MNTHPETTSLRTVVVAFGSLLIVASLGRLALVVPDWLAGAPPAYPGLYERQLFGVLTRVPLLSAVLLMQRTGKGAPARGRQAVVWALLAISVIAMVVEALRE